jgi:membrane protease YdiL (CAAX protease family)
MDKNLRIPSPWSQLALWVGLVCAAFVVVAVVSLFVVLGKVGVGGLRDQIDFSNPSLVGTLKVLQAVSTVILFGMPALLYARLTFREKPQYYLGMRAPAKGGFYLLGVLLLICSFPLEGWLGQINRDIPMPGWAIKMEEDSDRQILAFLKTDSPMGVLVNLFVIARLPAIFEELCFRGALQRILINCFKSPWGGIIVTAILFSGFHMQFQGFLPRMFLGILLGALYWYSGSIWTSIVAHFFTNGIQVVAVSIYPEMATKDPSVPVYAAIISAILVVGLLYWIRRLSNVSYSKEYEPNGHFEDFLSPGGSSGGS